jgi:D-alanyl-D-alanine carboxypeptidase
VNNAGLPPGLSQESAELSDFADLPLSDIPEAVREVPVGETASSPRQGKLLLAFSTGSVALLVLGLWLVPRLLQAAPAPIEPLENTAPQIMGKAIALFNGEQQPASLLNHLPYSEASRAELKPVSPDGQILLQQAAAAKFQQMVAAAKADGIILAPLSGFRSMAEQERIFFEVKAKRGQDPEKRAEVSAPPGYSEHHTGYAIDIGDGNRPATDLQTSFDTTAAYRWLKQNAAFYSFELSFPKNNPMGVSYEPWHWRFVGDRASLETFYRAREADQ